MRLLLLFALLLGAALHAAPAHAQSVAIEDQPDGVRLDLEDTPLQEAMSALSERFGFTVRMVRPSEARLTGSRTGSALELLNWILAGHDRAIFMDRIGDREHISRVVVFGPSGAAPPVTSPAPDEGIPDYGEEEDYEEPLPEEEMPPVPLDGGVDDYMLDPSMTE
ncbi:hypothetical protein [Geminicoccus flavidas]|uniref:hypothetical protein n=1 Tax=Geminicoccus flavidas TaxID=2506407 RepID=UPI00135C9D15|nr:hypothetical protein [Geminicoccus flavidas]